MRRPPRSGRGEGRSTLSGDADAGFAVLLFTLVRAPTGTGPGPGAEAGGAAAAAVERYRCELRSEMEPGAALWTAYDVVAEANERWACGGIDVARYSDLDRLGAAMPAIASSRRAQPTDVPFSSRSFVAREVPVRPAPEGGGLHGFSAGHAPTGYDRQRWQQRWRDHASLLTSTPKFWDYLEGYTQYHGLGHDAAAGLGADDIDGVAHMTYTSLDARAAALKSPEYVEILRPDEDQFVARNRGVSVLVARRA